MEHSEVVSKINEALDEIRPFLKSDGGDISFVKITDDNVVHVEFLGACTGCSVNQMTLKSGVEMTIRKYLPQVKQVVDVSKAGAL
jgi:Fe-S cluster biogenesis protein NfuA